MFTDALAEFRADWLLAGKATSTVGFYVSLWCLLNSRCIKDKCQIGHLFLSGSNILLIRAVRPGMCTRCGPMRMFQRASRGV